MRIIFAGTPEFSVPPLVALIEQGHEVVAVFTQPDRRAGRGKKLTAPPVKEIAQAHNIPVYQPDTFADQAALIRNLDVQVMIVVAYGMLLPKEILSIPTFGCINIHASILPRWRGAAPIQRAIEAGDKVSGVSIMKMAEGLDTGDVYQTLEVTLAPDETSASLHDKLAVLGADGICSTLEALQENPSLAAYEQDDSQSCYAKKISKTEAQLDWRASAEEIHAKIRAFIPWPVCQTHHEANRLRIWKSEISSIETEASPGTVIALNQDAIVVACQTGALSILSLQKDGGKSLSAKEFLNGHSLKIGDMLTADRK